MSKRILGGGIVAILILIFMAVFVPSSANAAVPCGTPAQEAVYETEVIPGSDAVYETKQVLVTPEIPGVPASDEQVLVKEAWTETVVDKEAWTETITDKEAWTETIPGTPSKWWNWSPNNYQGPQDFEPNWPVDERGTWQGPHTEGGPDGEGTFNVSHGNSGNSSWFHREPGTDEQIIEHPAETHTVEHPAETHTVEHPAEYKTVHHDAVPPVPAVYDTVTVLIKEAVPESTKQVLKTEATPAGPPCVKTPPKKNPAAPIPVVDNNPPTDEPPMVPVLAYTGSNELDPLLKWSLVLIVAGLVISAAGRRVLRSE
jgi:hypothetical protein